jgi:nucleotide-binding universal stress UspA family protein
MASTLSGVLRLIHVLPPQEVLNRIFAGSPQGEADALRARAESALQERAKLLAAQFGITPVCELLQGRAHEAIVRASESLDATLVVVGARGEHEGESPADALGGTAFKLIARSAIPVLLVRREIQEPYCHALACVKGVRTDRDVVSWADRLSPENLVHILSAYTVPYERRLTEWGASQSTIDVYATRDRDERTRQLSELLKEIGLPAARARLHVARGEPLETILSHAEQWKSDLIILGRRAQASEGLPGSIARQVAARAPADVMIVAPKIISRTAALMDSHAGVQT